MVVSKSTPTIGFFIGTTTAVPEGTAWATEYVDQGTIEIGTSDLDLNDSWPLIRLPQAAKITSIMTYNDDLDSHGSPTLALHCGLYNTGDKAAATITVSDTDVAYIGEGDTIVLISTDASTVTLTMQGQAGSTTSGSTSGSTLTAKTLASGSYATAVLHATAQAVEIRTAINHHTKFTATNDANVITPVQAVSGGAGDTTITITELGATGFSKTDFSGGGGTALGTVKDADLFAASSTIGQAANTGTELRFSARNIDTMGQSLFTLVGDSYGTVRYYDLYMTVATAAATAQAGTFSYAIKYTVVSYPYQKPG